MDAALPVSGLLLSLPGLLIWFVILILPWKPWSTRESLDAVSPARPADLSRITVLIPARNEAVVISDTLDALAAQGTGLSIFLIDDQSDDQTATIARNKQLPGLEIIKGDNLPDGWSGKLWALEQGRKKVKTEIILLLDADIRLEQGTIAAALEKLDRDQLDMLSLMAFLRMENFWEKLLMPAFVFFFKLLYPFKLSNSATPYVAAAAGGFILIRNKILDTTGAFGSLRHSLIDDCALARKVKTAGGKTWTGLTHSAVSLRSYNKLRDIWDMVARTAYTQLGHSLLLLLLCSFLMVPGFLFPLLSVFTSTLLSSIIGLVTLAIMFVCYLPTLKYYNIHFSWGFLLPVTGVLYLCMTWSSAWRHWFKSGARWKNRAYRSGIHL